MYSIPFDTDKLLDVIAANGGYAVSIEDNYGGGLGSAIADALVDAGDAFQLEQMYVERVPKSAKTPGRDARDVRPDAGGHHPAGAAGAPGRLRRARHRSVRGQETSPAASVAGLSRFSAARGALRGSRR